MCTFGLTSDGKLRRKIKSFLLFLLEVSVISPGEWVKEIPHSKTFKLHILQAQFCSQILQKIPFYQYTFLSISTSSSFSVFFFRLHLFSHLPSRTLVSRITSFSSFKPLH